MSCDETCRRRSPSSRGRRAGGRRGTRGKGGGNGGAGGTGTAGGGRGRRFVPGAGPGGWRIVPVPRRARRCSDLRVQQRKDGLALFFPRHLAVRVDRPHLLSVRILRTFGYAELDPRALTSTKRSGISEKSAVTTGPRGISCIVSCTFLPFFLAPSVLPSTPYALPSIMATCCTNSDPSKGVSL